MTATNIPTNQWNTLIDLLRQEGWRIVYKYDAFDAGIDFDLIVLEKSDEQILFGWDNWMEGEIRCSKERMVYIEQLARIRFTEGEPVNLKPSVVSIYFQERKAEDLL